MTDLLAARSQMAMSLGFHIVFAEIGIGFGRNPRAKYVNYIVQDFGTSGSR